MKKLLAIITAICLSCTVMFSSLISAETTTEYYGKLVGVGDSWCQGVGLGSADMEAKNAVTLTANTLGWKYENYGSGGKYANDVLWELNSYKSGDYLTNTAISESRREMIPKQFAAICDADVVFVHGGINDISSNFRSSMVGNIYYYGWGTEEGVQQGFNLGYIQKNYDPETKLIDGRTPSKYFHDTLDGTVTSTVNVLKNIADIIIEANPDALVVVSTMYCNYTGGIPEFEDGFTFEGLSYEEQISAADEMADYYYREIFEQANEGVKAFAANYDNVVVLDDSNIIPQQERAGDVNEYMNAGHPSANGYQLLSDGMVSLIREHYGEESPTFAHTATTAAEATTATTETTTVKETVPTDGTTLINAQDTKFIAHRGLHINGATENGINAFENAGKRNYWGIETDVHVTSDGKFIICHDDTTGRTGSPNLNIEQNTYDDLREVVLTDGTTIPSLEEYLQICKKYDKYAVLEIKNRMNKTYIEQIVSICEQEYSLDKMVFISFNWDNLVDLRDINSTVAIQYLSSSSPNTDNLKQYNFGHDVAYNALSATDVTNCHNNGIEVNAWTVDSKSTAEQLIGWGVDYITTNTLQPDPDPSATTTTATPDGYYDAYTATLSGGAAQNTNHTGYYGGGFVDNLGAVGTAVTFNVNVETEGNYKLDFRYANSCGDGKDAYPALYIDDEYIKELTFIENGQSSLANFAGWNVWSNNTEYIAKLSAGTHTIKLQFDRATYAINLDGLTLTATSEETTPTDPTSSTTTTTSASASTTTTTTTTTTASVSGGTETELLFSADYFSLSDNTANMEFQTSYEGYKMIVGKVSEGKGITMTSTVKLEPGVYNTTIYARARGTRPLFDIEVNGTVVGEGIDTSNTVLGTDNNAPVSLASVTIPSATYVTIKITGSAGITENYLYLNSIKFTKTASLSPVTMQKGAQMRLNEVNGIRFLTNLDTAKIKELKADGYTVEYGTLIAPADLLDGKELTFDLDTSNYINVLYNSEQWHNGVDGQIAGSIVRIQDKNIARNFVGRGYIKATKDGKSTYYYAEYSDSNVENNSRSLAFIANAYKTDSNSDYINKDQNIRDLIDGWISKLK